MPRRAQRRTSPRAISIVSVMSLAGLLLVGPTLSAVVSVQGLDSELGGLVAFRTSQAVSGTGYYSPLCADPTSLDCVVLSGVAYATGANTLVATTTAGAGDFYNDSALVNGFEEFSASGASISGVTPLNCSPRAPFYPGDGEFVYIPCYPHSLVVVDAETNSIETTLATPFDPFALAYDSASSELFVGAFGGTTVLAVNTTSFAVDGEVNLTGGEFLLTVFEGSGLAFDPQTDALLAPNPGQLLAMSKDGGPVSPVARLANAIMALSVDPYAPLIFASFDDPSSVLIYNSETYQLLANLSMPTCVEGFCGENQVTEFAFDPTHGDAFLASGLALFVVNASTLSVVGTVLTVGDGWCGSISYDSTSDVAWGTYEWAGRPIPGYFARLTYANSTTLTSLLWLTPSLALLVIGVAAGSSLAVVRFSRVTRADSRARGQR